MLAPDSKLLPAHPVTCISVGSPPKTRRHAHHALTWDYHPIQEAGRATELPERSWSCISAFLERDTNWCCYPSAACRQWGAVDPIPHSAMGCMRLWSLSRAAC